MPVHRRIKNEDDLASLVADAKAKGQTVVTTNGVYDFIHAGHVEYLEQARALGDMLVVLLNTDAAVRRIKGPTRPINSEQDRASVMAGLRCVDYVGFFDEDTPNRMLDRLKPSIHTKGGDYDPEKMPETALIRKNGGDVRILPFKEGYSNTTQYKRIKAAVEAEATQTFERPEWLANATKKE